ncbi:MAG: ATP-dependent DNA helicase RecG [Saprospiraceae bacterium]
MNNQFLDQSIEFVKGVGPIKAALLQKELQIATVNDLIQTFPFRYVDRSKFHTVHEAEEQQGLIQLKGVLSSIRIQGTERKKRLTAILEDETGQLELIWFQGIKWVEKVLIANESYVVFGKINVFRNKKSMAHPEMELLSSLNENRVQQFYPVYAGTEKLNATGFDSKARRKVIEAILSHLPFQQPTERLPDFLRLSMELLPYPEAIRGIHMPKSWEQQQQAILRLKFDELFFLQLQLLQAMGQRKESAHGYRFGEVGQHFHQFYSEKLPFELTGAQKRVIKEIRRDCGLGVQMNRLIQGDVGSGKTIVALMIMLLAIDNGFQACLMAPTEILAQQHYDSIRTLIEGMPIRVGYLTGNVKGKERKELLKLLLLGEINILIGTHALIEPPVVFKNLGLSIIDEQHRFGVEQRAKLWAKSHPLPPHILVMTATPIPRTLAMTLYGDLDISVIDELPPGRKSVVTVKKTEYHRTDINKFLKEQIKEGRQVYIVYPLIEESETLDLEDLNNGYERLLDSFPRPQYQISVVHGKLKQDDKEREMARFVKGETQIMVATTVIEVGVNIPNASVMVIENSERFGLSQLHQLRGRVGRGADQSYCVLMTGMKVSREALFKIKTMCETNDGFKIAEADLQLRGPGDIEGTVQSGLPAFKIADLTKDVAILQRARKCAEQILQSDPKLEMPQNLPLRNHLQKSRGKKENWRKIS